MSKNSRPVAVVELVGLEPTTPCLQSRCRSEEHTSELQSRGHLVCRLLLEKNEVNDWGRLRGCDSRRGHRAGCVDVVQPSVERSGDRSVRHPTLAVTRTADDKSIQVTASER